MFRDHLRLVFLIGTFLCSLNVAAATRFWTLTDVQFSDGAIATGYIGYDDLTNKVTDWNIRVTTGRSTAPSASYTYVPANSHAARSRITGYFSFASELGYLTFYDYGDEYWTPLTRVLLMAWLGPLDGSNVIVPLGEGNGGVEYRDFVTLSRTLTAGSLVLAASPPTAAIVQVDEFYNASLDHYFITADPAEKQALDTGLHSGWVRTGESFKAYATGSPAGESINPVCRYYGNPQAGLDSHFYAASGDECAAVLLKYGESGWSFESDNVFQIHLPAVKTGACPDGTTPVYRLWNQRKDSNHRYTTKDATRLRMLALGFLSEGYRPNGVVMCALI